MLLENILESQFKFWQSFLVVCDILINKMIYYDT